MEQRSGSRPSARMVHDSRFDSRLSCFFSLLYIYIFVLFLCLFLITFFPLAFPPLFILLAHYSLARILSAINVFLVMFIKHWLILSLRMHCLSRYEKLGKFREKILPQPPIFMYFKKLKLTRVDVLRDRIMQNQK